MIVFSRFNCNFIYFFNNTLILYVRIYFIPLCVISFLPTLGFTSLGPTDLCQAYEAERTYRQCQIFATQQRWYPGEVPGYPGYYINTQQKHLCIFACFNIIALPLFSVCLAVQMGLFACGHLASSDA